ncbi:hypothetical protein Lbir_2598 [Legionella birminghamensis]|uniref:Uncharacterized protein n=1 Tax=Legionella birminghamensis TaxID=28083 RepID=A0A378I926_9GAMM|nr:Ig domain-containing protein [Legionella birminghamensis]KTC67996.1 hypothetical protein Lbir_2598 [Legionella birminghamensis]STX31295.1 Uncharacterised protein [Legionella birminghamensis]
MIKISLLLVLVFKALVCFPFRGNPQGAAVLDYVFPPPQIVYAGEPVRFRVRADFFALGQHCIYYWKAPVNAVLTYVSGNCPLLNIGKIDPRTPFSFCYFDVTIPSYLNQAINGEIAYHNHSFNSRGTCGGNEFQAHSPFFTVKVIPHPLSIAAIPEQSATANLNFNFNLANAVNYYLENAQAGAPPVIQVEPVEQNGLRFNPASQSLTGKPRLPGVYHFKLTASNLHSRTAAGLLTVNVSENAKEKPVFIPELILPPAMASQLYQLNLSSFLMANSDFFSSDQIRFRLDTRQANADWIKLSADGQKLEGIVPDNDESFWSFTLIASSNAGGDSAAKTFVIEKAIDPEKKPIIQSRRLGVKAGDYFSLDIQDLLVNRKEHSGIRLYLDKVEPAAPWIHYGAGSQTRLEGEIPLDAMGETFEMTVHAASREGGNSEAVIIPLNVAANPVYQPRLKDPSLILPLAYTGQAYSFDFVREKTIYPDYRTIAYQVFLSDECLGISNPPWLRINNNKLEANIPEGLTEDIFFCLQIRNKPGGLSEATPLTMRIATSAF